MRVSLRESAKWAHPDNIEHQRRWMEAVKYLADKGVGSWTRRFNPAIVVEGTEESVPLTTQESSANGLQDRH